MLLKKQVSITFRWRLKWIKDQPDVSFFISDKDFKSHGQNSVDLLSFEFNENVVAFKFNTYLNSSLK